jgi:hypothetical protein
MARKPPIPADVFLPKPRYACADSRRSSRFSADIVLARDVARRGGRKVIIAPNGGDAWVPAKPQPDEK